MIFPPATRDPNVRATSAMNPTRTTTQKDGYIFIRQLLNVDGQNNAGLQVVQQATNPGPNQLALCKLLCPDDGGYKEADLLSLVGPHANIVQYYNFFTADDSEDGGNTACPLLSYISKHDRLYMEYCEGGTIRDVIKRYKSHFPSRKPPEAFIWHVLESLLKALCRLHLGIENVDLTKVLALVKRRQWKSIAHKDIRPDNVLLTNKPFEPTSSTTSMTTTTYPRILLADFGIADHPSDREEDSDMPPAEWLDIGYVVIHVINPLCYGGNSQELRKLLEKWKLPVDGVGEMLVEVVVARQTLERMGVLKYEALLPSGDG